MDSTISRFDLVTRQQTVVVASLMPGYSDCWVITSKGILFLRMEAGPVIRFHSFATGKETTLAEVSGSLPPLGLSGFPSLRMNELYSWCARTLYRQIFKLRIFQAG
jgi:hypothetical protein